MNRGSIARLTALTLIVSVVLVWAEGCAPVSQTEKTDFYSSFRHDRELEMRERWAGRLYADLVAEMGHEGESMTTPNSQGRTSSAVVFGVNDPISGCVDSFIIINGEEPIIDNYFCR
ncbi:MAG: hypothetical protein V7752_14145 [Halopseudomonas sp.]